MISCNIFFQTLICLDFECQPGTVAMAFSFHALVLAFLQLTNFPARPGSHYRDLSEEKLLASSAGNGAIVSPPLLIGDLPLATGQKMTRDRW